MAAKAEEIRTLKERIAHLESVQKIDKVAATAAEKPEEKGQKDDKIAEPRESLVELAE